jgi:hypothetical protein
MKKQQQPNSGVENVKATFRDDNYYLRAARGETYDANPMDDLGRGQRFKPANGIDNLANQGWGPKSAGRAERQFGGGIRNTGLEQLPENRRFSDSPQDKNNSYRIGPGNTLGWDKSESHPGDDYGREQRPMGAGWPSGGNLPD